MPSAPSIANSVTVRLVLPARATAVSEMTGVIEAAGGVVTGLDVTASGASQIRIDLTMLTHDPEHADAIVARMREVEGVEIGRVSDRTFLLHLGGKLSVESKVPIRSRDDLSMIYTPGGGAGLHGHRREPGRTPAGSPSSATPSPSSPTARRCSAWATSARSRPCR